MAVRDIHDALEQLAEGTMISWSESVSATNWPGFDTSILFPEREMDAVETVRSLIEESGGYIQDIQCNWDGVSTTVNISGICTDGSWGLVDRGEGSDRSVEADPASATVSTAEIERIPIAVSLRIDPSVSGAIDMAKEKLALQMREEFGIREVDSYEVVEDTATLTKTVTAIGHKWEQTSSEEIKLPDDWASRADELFQANGSTIQRMMRAADSARLFGADRIWRPEGALREYPVYKSIKRRLEEWDPELMVADYEPYVDDDDLVCF